METSHYGWALEGCSLSPRAGCSLCYDMNSLLLLLPWTETLHSVFLSWEVKKPQNGELESILCSCSASHFGLNDKAMHLPSKDTE